MNRKDKEKLVTGLECCLGIDSRRCEGCPYKRYHGIDDGKCCERLLRASLVAIQEDKA